MKDMEKMFALHCEISRKADEIKALFKDKVAITIIVRNLERPHANALVTDDETHDRFLSKEFLEDLTVDPTHARN